MAARRDLEDDAAVRFAAFGVTIEVAGPPDVVRSVSRELGFLPGALAGAPPELRYCVRDGIVTESGEVLAPVPASATPAEVVCDHVHFALAQRATAAHFVHAGAVLWRGHGLVIPGRSHSGKSSLVAALVDAGATYYSDEYAVITDDGTLLPYPRSLVRRGADGTRRFVAASALGSRPHEALVRPSVVLATPFTGTPTTRGHVVTGSRAVLPILDNMVRARAEPRRTVALAARLSTEVAAVVGERGDVAEAVPVLLSLVDGILDRATRDVVPTP